MIQQPWQTKFHIHPPHPLLQGLLMGLQRLEAQPKPITPKPAWRLGIPLVVLLSLSLAQAQAPNRPNLPQVSLGAEAELHRIAMEPSDTLESAAVYAHKAITLAQMTSMALSTGQFDPQMWQAAVHYAELAWYQEPQNPNYIRLLAEFYTVSELWYPAYLLWVDYANQLELDEQARSMVAGVMANIAFTRYRLGLHAQAITFLKASLELEENPEVANLLNRIQADLDQQM